jgi:ribosomal protein S18 acetylase RimI-like enzyme
MQVDIIEGNLNIDSHKQNFVKLLNEYISDKMGGGAQFNEETRKKLLNDLLNFPTLMIYFAKFRETFIGMAVCFLGYSTFKAKRLINIHDIIVSKDFRNKGVGRKIIETVIKKGKELDCCKITLEVRNDNENAKKLYQSIGFDDSTPPMFFWNKPL